MVNRNLLWKCKIPATAKCAICGTIKRETNHWFMVNLNTHIEGSNQPSSEIHIFAYEQDYLDDDSGYPAVCGTECLMKIVSGNLDIIYPPKDTKEMEIEK